MVIDKELERGTRVTVRLTSPPPPTGGKKSKSTFSVFLYTGVDLQKIQRSKVIYCIECNLLHEPSGHAYFFINFSIS